MCADIGPTVSLAEIIDVTSEKAKEAGNNSNPSAYPSLNSILPLFLIFLLAKSDK